MSKLLFMYVKKLAEPLAQRIIVRAKQDDLFKKMICLPPANLYHFYEAKIKFRVMNIGKIRMKSVPKMSEKDAIVLGANLFAECCFYAVASAIALNEVLKFKAREKEKDFEYDEEFREYREYLERLDNVIDKQICDIHRLENIVDQYNIALTKDVH